MLSLPSACWRPLLCLLGGLVEWRGVVCVVPVLFVVFPVFVLFLFPLCCSASPRIVLPLLFFVLPCLSWVGKCGGVVVLVMELCPVLFFFPVFVFCCYSIVGLVVCCFC